MPIRFYCPLGHRLVVPDERAGKKGRCPQCRQKVYVPVADPRPSGQPKQPLAGEAIELDQAGDASPGVLDAPRAAAPGGSQGQLATATARRLSPAEKSPAAAPADPRDPLALALDEITAMQHDKDQAVVYMPRSEEPSSHSGSVSKWLPPPAAKAATGAAAAPGTSAVAVPPATPDPPGAGPAANLAPIAALPAAASGAMAPVRG
jgi:hypothetical protein